MNYFKGKDIRFELLVRLVRLIDRDYRLTWPYLDWWQDPWFNEYLIRFGEISGMNTHRRWQMFQLLRLVDSLEGDTAECGAFRGASSFLICEANQRSSHNGRWHHVFDSFAGLSAPEKKDGVHWSEGDLSAPLADLQSMLSPYSRYTVYPGWIPDRFVDVEDRRFSFVHIDVDLYGPTRDSIEFFYPRLEQGAILVCDDYGCTTCPGSTEAIDSFLMDKPEQFVSLAAGGGFMIKGVGGVSSR